MTPSISRLSFFGVCIKIDNGSNNSLTLGLIIFIVVYRGFAGYNF